MAPVLDALHRNGLGIDAAYQKEFLGRIERERDAIYDTIQTKVPIHVLKVKSWKRKPKKIDADGTTEVTIGKHKDEILKVRVKLVANPEGGMWCRLPFNPRLAEGR
jgi:hypothetical protein